MPWKVMKEGNKYCVHNEDTGKKIACHASESAAEKQVKALYSSKTAKEEKLEELTLEGAGPVILGIAATNRPHLPLPPMSIIGEGDDVKIRVPFLRKGVFRHPNGELIFNDKVLERMLDNYNTNKSHYGVSLDIKHKPELGALAWFDKSRGGKILAENDPEFGDLLVAYGKPTSDDAIKIIKNGQYAYASVEFHPNHKSNLVSRLSLDDLEETTLEEVIEVKLENKIMEEVTITLEEYNQLKASNQRITELEDVLKDNKTKLEAAESNLQATQARLAEFEVETPEIPEEYRIRLEAQENEIRKLKKNALKNQVDLLIEQAKAHRDDSGRGHSPILLEIAREALLGNEISVGEETIKLESTHTADVVNYYREVFVHLLKVLPGQVQLEDRTLGDADDQNPFSLEAEYSDEDFANFWKA